MVAHYFSSFIHLHIYFSSFLKKELNIHIKYKTSKHSNISFVNLSLNKPITYKLLRLYTRSLIRRSSYERFLFFGSFLFETVVNIVFNALDFMFYVCIIQFSQCHIKDVDDILCI